MERDAYFEYYLCTWYTLYVYISLSTNVTDNIIEDSVL